MPVDSSIPLGVQPIKLTSPQELYAAKTQIEGNRLQQALGQMQLEGAQLQRERQNRLSSLLANQYEKPEDRESALLQGGFIEESNKIQKQRADTAKTESEARVKQIEAAQKKLDIAGQAFGYVRNNPTLEAANSVLDYLGENGIYTPDQVAQYKAQVAANPAKIKALADQAFTATVNAKDQLIKIDTRNLGGVTQTAGTNPLTGEVKVLNTVKNTASPDAILSAETQRRGQNLTDARARETNQISRDTKPLTEGQAKSAAFGSRMLAADEVINSLEKSGKLFSTPGSRAGYGIGAAVNLLNSAEGQQLDQAKRDFINATLRRESGAVISDAEFDNAEKQYFPQIGDSPAVIKQKARNRQIAQRGVIADVPENRREGLVREITGSKPASNIDALLDKYK